MDFILTSLFFFLSPGMLESSHWNDHKVSWMYKCFVDYLHQGSNGHLLCIIGLQRATDGRGQLSNTKDSGYTYILQDKTLFWALEAGDIVCWLVNQPIAKLDLFKSFNCRWICKTYAEYCYRNSATVSRLVQSPTLQSTIFCGVHSDLCGKGIRVSPAW